MYKYYIINLYPGKSPTEMEMILLQNHNENKSLLKRKESYIPLITNNYFKNSQNNQSGLCQNVPVWNYSLAHHKHMQPKQIKKHAKRGASIQ